MMDAPTAERGLPPAIADFAAELRSVTAGIDPATGWYAVFNHRDPDGLRACLAGREVPPWDVVEALLQDLSAAHGAAVCAEPERRLRERYALCIAVCDREAGARERLLDLLDVRQRERQWAARRERELMRALQEAQSTGDTAETERLAPELAWARDDLRRASVRCTALGERLAALDAGSGPGGSPSQDASGAGPAAPDRPEPVPGEEHPAAVRPQAPRPPRSGAPSGPATGRRKGSARGQGPMPRGARFAGLEAASEPDSAPGDPGAGASDEGRGDRAADPTASVPDSGATGMQSADGPRGARFAGALDTGRAPRRTDGRRPVLAGEQLAEAHRAATEAVRRLAGLRAQGCGGQAHAALCEAAGWSAPWLPVLVAELERTGLSADVPTLLWEVAYLPPGQLADAADALAAAGRAEDCERLLRQGAARSVTEVAAVALALAEVGRTEQAAALLAAFLRPRGPGTAVEVALEEPAVLVPLLLDGAATISRATYRDVAGALRIGGLAGVPDAL